MDHHVSIQQMMANLAFLIQEQHSTTGMFATTPAQAVGSEIASSGRSAPLRHSVELNMVDTANGAAAGIVAPAGHVGLQPTYSGNDIPTINTLRANSVSTNNHAQQHLHNHNASIGRVPAGAIPTRNTNNMYESMQDSMNMQTMRDQAAAAAAYASIGATLQAVPNNVGSTGFGLMNPVSSAVQMPMMAPYGNFFQPQNQTGNTMDQAALMMANLNLISPGFQHGMPAYGQMGPMSNNAPTSLMSTNGNVNNGSMTNGINGNMNNSNASQPRDSQQRVIQSRRTQDNSESKFGVPVVVVCDFGVK